MLAADLHFPLVSPRSGPEVAEWAYARGMAAPTPPREFYSPSMRAVQDRFDGRRLADRLEEVTLHRTFSADDCELIDQATTVFVATADADGWPDCSYKGGSPGFVRVLGDNRLALAVYDGNSQFRTLGNLLANPRIGMLFMDAPRARRLRVNGSARVVLPEDDAPLVASFPGAIALVEITALQLFPNCNRYIHDAADGTVSVYAPAPGHEPPEAEWKRMDLFSDVLPDPGATGATGERA